MNKIKKLFAAATLFLVIGLVALPAFAQAAVTTGTTQTTQQRCDAFKQQFSLTSGMNIIGGSKVFCSATDLITWGINLLISFSGVITMIFLIVGGYMLLTSAGNEEQSEKGKKILTNSLIGLVVILMAAALVRIVASLLT
jgi:hypothetical protein